MKSSYYCLFLLILLPLALTQEGDSDEVGVEIETATGGDTAGGDEGSTDLPTEEDTSGESPPASEAAAESPTDTKETTEISAESPSEESAATPESSEASEDAEKSAEASTEDTAEEPAEDTAEEPAEDSAEEPAEDTAEEPAEDSAEEPAEDSAEEPAEDSAEEPAEDSAEVPAEGSSEGDSETPAATGSPPPVASTPVLETVQGYQTADGQLAAGMEHINGNIQTLRGELNDYAQLADEELDSALEMTTQATSILVNSQIIQLQQQLRETETLVDELRARINESTQICQTFVSCDDCSRDSACVWCQAERSCVAGDRNGPLGGECFVFSYGACQGECADHSQCAACLTDPRCGWCENGQICSPADTHLCDESFWLLKGSTCPGVVSTTSSYKSVNLNPFVDTQLSRLQRELRENMDKAAKLREQIDSMTGEMKQVVGGVNSADLGDIEDVDTSNTLSGLATLVDYASKQDNDEMLAKTRELAEEVGKQVSGDTVAAVQASNDARIQEEQKFMETIKSMTQTMVDQNAAITSELASQQAMSTQLEAENAQVEATASAPAESAPAESAPASDSTASFLQEANRYRSFLRP